MLQTATMTPIAMDRLSPRALGQRIVARRLALNLDQGAVAMRADLSRAYISRLENGLVPSPKLNDLEAVAQAVNLGLADLLANESGEDGNEPAIGRRFSADWDTIQREVEDLPPEDAERVLRLFRVAVDIAKSSQHALEN